jgi:hypothetical protein
VEGAVHYIQRHFGLAHSNFGSEQEFDETPDLLAGQLSEERSPLFSYRQSDGVALDNWRLFLLCRAGTTGGRRVYTSPGKVYLGISLCQTSRALQEFDGTRILGCFLEDHGFCPGPTAAPACAWRRPIVPDSAGRARPPCSPPSRIAAPLAAPPHSRTPGPQSPRTACTCSIFSALIPQSGHRTRYSSITTVVRPSKHGRSRISRS